MAAPRPQSGLSDGYGVVIGTQIRFNRDDPNHFGHYYHDNLIIQTGSHNYHYAIDIDSDGPPGGHEWSIFSPAENDFPAVRSLSNGWHLLTKSEWRLNGLG